ncbi:vesicle-associated membrane protein 3 [Pezoporus wallicus]|uniref:vesicle-associated membrane protein 3 n=1 Tax=Pezoporus wallicus TaxID=35540 RepID=UPI00255097BE|nr:vesicle-associated membrane protein 3 [Pezoporus wallicus]
MGEKERDNVRTSDAEAVTRHIPEPSVRTASEALPHGQPERWKRVLVPGNRNCSLSKGEQNNGDFLYCRSASVPGSSNVAAGGNRRLQQTQHQVDEVVDIMRVNVDKVLERDQKLSELDDRADALQAGASQFETSAAKLKRKYWWKNCKMWVILIAVVVMIIIIIVGKFHRNGDFS